MRVYDCILFFNEMELLELRLKTLGDVVDYFVIVEAPWTFQGRPKPLLFQENHREFLEWIPRIRHIALSGDIDTDNPWDREYASRNAMLAGIDDAEPDDLIFQSDCDEIWRPEKMLEKLDEQDVTVFYQDMSYYALNMRAVPPVRWPGTRRVRFKRWTNGQDLRDVGFRTKPGIPTPPFAFLENAGWHFSFIGSADSAVYKIKSFSHSEFNTGEYVDTGSVARRIELGQDIFKPDRIYAPVPIDDTFPKPMLEDPERWEHLTRPVEVPQ